VAKRIHGQSLSPKNAYDTSWMLKDSDPMYYETTRGLTPWQRWLKRSFDVTVALLGLILSSWLILLAWLAATLSTGYNGFFTQLRIGRYGRPFYVIKLRTMKVLQEPGTTVTTDNDPRITTVGKLLRKTKVDELPQLLNVLVGDMSLVGPRPDVPGFADKLEGEDLIILTVRPGITGPATLKYRNEEEILAAQLDPESYNARVIYPDKVKINREYVEHYSFAKDLRYILHTITGEES
jgi:lipopolysaccharide/colanic/teichoic acid biosynthesis glycosyltransferase